MQNVSVAAMRIKGDYLGELVERVEVHHEQEIPIRALSVCRTPCKRTLLGAAIPHYVEEHLVELIYLVRKGKHLVCTVERVELQPAAKTCWSLQSS